MINSAPNNSNYHQGNFIPTNKEKVIKLNNKGGVYYRSSWEFKIMRWLDTQEHVTKWGSECIKIPYQLTHFDGGDIKVKEHVYYADIYYELMSKNGDIRRVVAEIKPLNEFNDVKNLLEEKMSLPSNPSVKKLKNFEYSLKMAQKNSEKWKNMIKFCEKKGWEFIIITEEHLKKFNL